MIILSVTLYTSADSVLNQWLYYRILVKNKIALLNFPFIFRLRWRIKFQKSRFDTPKILGEKVMDARKFWRDIIQS
jgi:hypothetical protein